LYFICQEFIIKVRKKERRKDMTYLRRMVVPKEKAPAVINYLKENITQQLMVSELNIGGSNYYAIKFVSDTPVVVQGDATVIARNATVPSIVSILKNIYTTDKDLPTSIIVNSTDYAAVDNSAADDYAVTVEISDPDGETSSLEYTISVVDASSATITLTATTVDVAAAAVAAWDPADNIATAVDDGDDVSASVVITYKEDDADGADIASLALARTHLGTEGNQVFVMYNYSDASGNPATEKTATFTAVA
jgi:hypothetical protein